MEKTALIFCILASSQSMALTTIYDAAIDGKTVVSAQKYLRFSAVAAPEIKNASSAQQMPGLPAKSKLKDGSFDSYKLSECQKYPVPFFVVGDDALSIAWLKAHNAHLKEVHALGLITNIKTKKDLEKIEAISPVNLIPSIVDGLAEAIEASFYPFFTNGCEVWQ